jgi:hypothetical protein
MFIDPWHQFGHFAFAGNAMDPVQLAKPFSAGAVAGLAVSLPRQLGRTCPWLIEGIGPMRRERR